MNTMKKNLKLIKNNKTKCPTCGSFALKSYYPFCSQRCSSIDLGKWFDGKYSIPSVEDPDGLDIVQLSEKDKS